MMKELKLKSYDETLSVIKHLIDLAILGRAEIDLLLSVFDNERPDYAFGQNLEMGGILFDSEEIIKLTKKQALTLSSEIKNERPVTLFWSQWSARKYVEQLSLFLQELLDNEVRSLGVKTRWISEGLVDVEDASIVLPEKDTWIYCVDFLIGSGGTLRRMHEILSLGGIEAQKTIVMIDKPTILKVFKPILMTPYVVIENDYWTFGYGSDAKINGIEVGRNLPFLACLVPIGQGIRKQLKENLGG